jgi:hypothetical protein
VPTRHPPVEGSWSAGQIPATRRLAVPLREFLDTEVAGGLVLLAATAVALGWANSPWNGVAWARQATPSPPGGPKLYGAAAVGPSTIWGVGYRYDQRLAANQTFTIRTTNG